MNWYYVEAGQQAGPVTETDFVNLVSNGRIGPETLVWREGMANWQPYSNFHQGASSAVPPQPATTMVDTASVSQDIVCAECGKIFSRDNALQYGTVWVCAACKPIFVQRIKEGAALPGQGVAMAYAGFWIRALAKIIDIAVFTVILGIPIGILVFRSVVRGPGPPQMMLGFQIVVQLLAIIVTVGYSTFLLGRFGATLGKMACGLKVVTAEGTPITYLRAFGRAWGEQLSGMVCYIGYIIAGFDNEKRALHDHICSTRVIRK